VHHSLVMRLIQRSLHYIPQNCNSFLQMTSLGFSAMPQPPPHSLTRHCDGMWRSPRSTRRAMGGTSSHLQKSFASFWMPRIVPEFPLIYSWVGLFSLECGSVRLVMLVTYVFKPEFPFSNRNFCLSSPSLITSLKALLTRSAACGRATKVILWSACAEV
jgi:hypothetical protein